MNYENDIKKVGKIINISSNACCMSSNKNKENRTNKDILKKSEETFLDVMQDVYNKSKNNN